MLDVVEQTEYRKIPTTVGLTARQINAMTQAARKQQISVSDLLRRMIDKWMRDGQGQL